MKTDQFVYNVSRGVEHNEKAYFRVNRELLRLSILLVILRWVWNGFLGVHVSRELSRLEGLRNTGSDAIGLKPMPLAEGWVLARY